MSSVKVEPSSLGVERSFRPSLKSLPAADSDHAFWASRDFHAGVGRQYSLVSLPPPLGDETLKIYE